MSSWANGLGCMIGMQEAARQMIAQGAGPDGIAGKIVMIDGGMTLV